MATRELRTAVVIEAKDRTGRAVRSTRRGVESVSRSLDTLQRRAIAVHPRSRGEHGVALMARTPAGGSSPLARGTPLAELAGPAPLRFIPARAGNTRRRSPMSMRKSVHPRSRGEHNAPPP